MGEVCVSRTQQSRWKLLAVVIALGLFVSLCVGPAWAEGSERHGRAVASRHTTFEFGVVRGQRSEPLYAEVAADGERVFYTAGNKIYGWSKKSRKTRLLSRSFNDWGEAAVFDVSGNGRKVVFSGVQRNTGYLFLLDTRSRKVTRIALLKAVGAAISHSGRWVAYDASNEAGNRLLRYDTRTGERTEIESTDEDLWYQSGNLSMSADGSTVAAVVGEYTCDVFVWSVATGERTTVTRNSACSATKAPSLSQDGSKLLYLGYWKKGRLSYKRPFVWRRDSGEATRVKTISDRKRNTYDVDAAVMSADGRTIAYQTDSDYRSVPRTASVLIRSDLRGNHRTKVVDTHASGGWLVLNGISADGRSISYRSARRPRPGANFVNYEYLWVR